MTVASIFPAKAEAPVQEKVDDVRERAKDAAEYPRLTNPFGRWYPSWDADDRAWFPR